MIRKHLAAFAKEWQVAYIHANYLSQKDIDTCLGFDINSLADEKEFPAIKALYDAFVSEYSTE